jgi:hypothetical protein
MLLKLRNILLHHLAGKTRITGINTQEQWDEAGYDSILFHAIMKWPLREIVRVLPDIPLAWINNLTGTRKHLYEIVKKEWYDNDQNAERKAKLWKPFLYFLVLWENDEVLEPADRVFCETLKRRDEFYINLARQDPANWYMDRNPALPDNQPGRVKNLFNEDPAIRFDTLNQLYGYDSIVTLGKPDRNFICIRDQEGKPRYLIINRHDFTTEPDGGFRYRVIDIIDDQIQAAMLGMKIQRERMKI